MTAEEERLLKAYLGAYGEIESADDNAGFYDWYMKRYEGGEDERNYKHTLDLARVWASRYTQGYSDGYRAALEEIRLPYRGGQHKEAPD